MDKHDRENLNFILTRTQDQLIEWFQNIRDDGDQDEIDYALELMVHAKCQIEMELLTMIDHDAEHDVGLASNYLQRFRLQ
jgi:hypothetical protein